MHDWFWKPITFLFQFHVNYYTGCSCWNLVGIFVEVGTLFLTMMQSIFAVAKYFSLPIKLINIVTQEKQNKALVGICAFLLVSQLQVFKIINLF